MALRLRHGAADLAAVQREASRLAGGKLVESYPLTAQALNTERSIHLQAVALWLVSGLLAVIGLLVLGQLLARLSFMDAAEYGTLLALGMSRRALFGAGLGRAAVIGAAGSADGVLLAVLASPLLPVGVAGVAEPYPGIHADGHVLVLGLARHGARGHGGGRMAGLAGGGRGTGAGPRRGRDDQARAGHRARPAAATRRGRDREHPPGDGGDRAAAGPAARSGPYRTAGAQHDRQRRSRRGCADRGAGLLGQPRPSARHAVAVRRDLGRLREQYAARRDHPGGPQHHPRPGGDRLDHRVLRCPG